MLRCLGFILIISVSYQSSLSQVNPEWRDKDRKLFDSIYKLDKNKPEEIEKFFSAHWYPIKPDTLGFGWVKLEKAIGGGYVSIKADFFYFKDTIRTYILYAYLPDENDLLDDYRTALAKFLPISENAKYSYTYNGPGILMPLVDFFQNNLKPDTSNKILKYMAPTSGIVYGYIGGIAGTTLQNRKLFNEIRRSLRSEQVIEIMYSINPASRLTAIEYYLANKSKFKNQALIDHWIQKVYQDCPEVATMRGCLMSHENSKNFVNEFAKNER